MQKDALTDYANQLISCINAKGKLCSSDEEMLSTSKTCEALAKRLLGTTLVVKGKRFVIRRLEAYYGGIGDDGHDWYRTRFVYKRSKYKERTAVQSLPGFRVYLSSSDRRERSLHAF
jgi:hypothetical protein